MRYFGKNYLEKEENDKSTRHNFNALKPDPSAAHTLNNGYDLQELWK
jgi:hypothetical protein